MSLIIWRIRYLHGVFIEMQFHRKAEDVCVQLQFLASNPHVIELLINDLHCAVCINAQLFMLA